MTSNLIEERNTLFINGYAVQWFSNILKNTKVMIYSCIPGNTYIYMTEITIDYVADRFSVESVAKEKIKEIERL